LLRCRRTLEWGRKRQRQGKEGDGFKKEEGKYWQLQLGLGRKEGVM
jgi:hypothetical protein